MSKKLDRIFRAFAREGLLVSKDGPVYVVAQKGRDGCEPARVLLPDGFALEQKSFQQLSAFAGVTHPAGGRVEAVRAMPDFHAGSLAPVGSVIATTLDIVIPQALGTDIQCGMRLHVADLTVDAFLARKAEWLRVMKGDLLLGTRDLPMRVDAVRAMFNAGAPGWLEATRAQPLGLLERANLDQIEMELARRYVADADAGDEALAPQEMLPADRDVVRDSYMGTVGGGNHFVEVQVVDEILDKGYAFAWGVRRGQIAIMIHSGSRGVGGAVGHRWMDHARQIWPAGLPHPDGGIFALHGADAARYVQAVRTAANYADVNRLLLAEMVRDRLRHVYGRDLEVPIVFDVPHNTVTREGDRYIHRKGATPAHEGQPVLIPGSMGQSSFLLVGLGNRDFLSSASHGAGRAVTRGEMRWRAGHKEDIGLAGVECITLKEERMIEEAPAAYKDIGPVVSIQADVGIARPVARMRPILTFKA